MYGYRLCKWFYKRMSVPSHAPLRKPPSQPSSSGFRQEGQNLTPRQLLAQNRCPVVKCPMQMENVLCKIDADDDDGSVYHVDASSFYASSASFDDTWHIVMPSGGGIHTINFRLEADRRR